MSCELKLSREFVNAVVKAAIQEDWKMVDEKLIPQLVQYDGNQIAEVLLPHADNPDENVRDVVATAAAHLQITDTKVLEDLVERMQEQVKGDDGKFAAGRAVVFLLNHYRYPKFQLGIQDALNIFYSKARRFGWEDELTENIPELEDFFE